MSGYVLGVDIGTTYTAAAVVRDGLAEVVPLGARSSVVPTVVYLREDGTFLVGEPADRRALAEPHRIAREFKRRMGDPTPIVLGGTPQSPQALTARVLRWTVDRVAEVEGCPPTRLALTHPANWGPYKLDLLEQAVRLADLDAAIMLTEPEAAAAFYASRERLGQGDTVAVYDLGGGTFDSAILQRTEHGFEMLGTPEGIEQLGGIDVDEAVLGYVANSIGRAVLDGLDTDDPAAMSAVARLRRECTEAKEALSADEVVGIPVALPAMQREVTLTRHEFDAAVRPMLGDTVGALRRALASAGVDPADLSAVLLVGGSSRMPVVADVVADEIGRPVAVDTQAKQSVALGAALVAAASDAIGRGEAAGSVDVVLPRVTPAVATATAQSGQQAEASTRGDAVGVPPTRRPRWWWFAAAAATALIAGAIAVVATGGDDGENAATRTGSPSGVSVVDTGADSVPAGPSSTDDSPTPTTDLAPAGSGSFGAGTMVVGADVAPGVYVAQVPGDVARCSWQRLDDLSGEAAAIAASGDVEGGGQAAVELLPTDAGFESSDCGRWAPVAPLDPPATELGEGVWVVGTQIDPGRYRSAGRRDDAASCYWERSGSLADPSAAIIANEIVFEGTVVVDVADTDVAFRAAGCEPFVAVEER